MDHADPSSWLTVRATPNELVLHRQLQDEAVLLDMRNEQYHGLDPMANAFWNALVAAPNIAAAVDALLADYDVDRDVLGTDMANVLDALVARDLVVLVPAGSDAGEVREQVA